MFLRVKYFMLPKMEVGCKLCNEPAYVSFITGVSKLIHFLLIFAYNFEVNIPGFIPKTFFANISVWYKPTYDLSLIQVRCLFNNFGMVASDHT